METAWPAWKRRPLDRKIRQWEQWEQWEHRGRRGNNRQLEHQAVRTPGRRGNTRQERKYQEGVGTSGSGLTPRQAWKHQAVGAPGKRGNIKESRDIRRNRNIC